MGVGGVGVGVVAVAVVVGMGLGGLMVVQEIILIPPKLMRYLFCSGVRGVYCLADPLC